jgi:hypothetical protein
MKKIAKINHIYDKILWVDFKLDNYESLEKIKKKRFKEIIN